MVERTYFIHVAGFSSPRTGNAEIGLRLTVEADAILIRHLHTRLEVSPYHRLLDWTQSSFKTSSPVSENNGIRRQSSSE
jgi:hypothetical protein